jgi:hypothetical protein
MDDKNGRVCYLVADVGHWFFPKKVLISTRQVQSIDWDRARVNITPTREAIKRVASRAVVHGWAAVS